MSRETRGRSLRILAFLLASVCLCWVIVMEHEESCVSRWFSSWIRHSADGENNTQRAARTAGNPESDLEPSKLWNPLEELPVGYGRIPFPLENERDLPTAFASVKSCRDGVDYLFFVHVASDHWEDRSILRNFLGNTTLSTLYNWTTVFFVGLSTDNATNIKVREEAMQYGDMVVLPYLDSYRNLTYKYVYGMKWTIDNCPSATYNVKMDDDMVINLTKAFTYLKNVSYSNATAFHCTVFDHAKPIRDKKSKWYVKRFTYLGKYYPKYCTGGVVFLNSSVLRALYEVFFSVPFFWIDDVYVTGMAAKVAGVGHVDLKENYIKKDSKNAWGNIVGGQTMLAHIDDAGNRSTAWKHVMSQLQGFRTNASFYT